MKVVRESDDFGGANGEGADCKLKKLEGVGGDPGLEVGHVGGVDGKDPAPVEGGGRGGEVSGLPRGDGDEIGLLDVGFDLLQRRREVRFRHLLHY